MSTWTLTDTIRAKNIEDGTPNPKALNLKH